MKKSLILLALPLLMGSITFSNQARSGLSEIKEDTVAHEELFGRAGAQRNFGGAIKHNAATLDGAKIGYQIQYNEETNKLAIRFLAAIKDTNVQAIWSRAVAKGDGSEVKAMDHNQVCEKYYHTLVNGDVSITAGEGDYTGYAGFVVYTLYNIPYEEYKDSYVVAYLSLYDEADVELDDGKSTEPYAVKIEMNNEKTGSAFSFTVNRDDCYFLYGINGATTIPTWIDDAENYAVFNDVTLDEGESYLLFSYSSSKFLYHSYAGCFNTSIGFFNNSSLVSGAVTPYKSGTYNLYVSKGSGTENKVYTTAKSFSNPVIDLYLGVESWGYSNAKYAIWAWGAGVESKWIEPVEVNEKLFKFEGFNIGTYTGFKFTRHDKTKEGYSWEEANKTVWNETDNLSIENLVAATSIAHVYFQDSSSLISWLTYSA